MKTTIYWSAKNNGSFMIGVRTAGSMRAAVRAARRYVQDELYGEGVALFFDKKPCADDDIKPVRRDERGVRTGYRWVTCLNPYL